MKTTNRTILTMMLISSAALFAGGCESSEAKRSAGVAPANESVLQRQGEQVRQETQEAVQATKDYAQVAKAEFAREMKEEMARINATLQEFEAKVENASDVDEAKAKLKELKEKAAALNTSLEQTLTVEDDTWEQMKTGFKKSQEELKESVDQARGWLSVKIAP